MSLADMFHRLVTLLRVNLYARRALIVSSLSIPSGILLLGLNMRLRADNQPVIYVLIASGITIWFLMELVLLLMAIFPGLVQRLWGTPLLAHRAEDLRDAPHTRIAKVIFALLLFAAVAFPIFL